MNEISQELRKEPQLFVIISSNAVQIQMQIKKYETRPTLTAGAWPRDSESESSPRCLDTNTEQRRPFGDE